MIDEVQMIWKKVVVT